jgi:hypothetical protein
MTGKVQGLIQALGLISESRKGLLAHKFTKLSLEASVLNSRSIAGWLNMKTLWTVRKGGGVAAFRCELSTQLLKV